jgi:hypothetical protein
MKFKKILLTIFFAFHLTLSLKSIDFCIAKQETCKGFYDEQHDYQTKCEPNKCHGKFSYDCVSNTCSLNRKSCNEYKIALSRFLQIINDLKASDSVFSSKHLAETKTIKLFNRAIKNCVKKIFEFKKSDFCLNGKNCVQIGKEMIGFGLNYRSLTTIKDVDCKCPIKHSFKCDKYCAADSNACDYYKSNKKDKQFLHRIKNCGNDKITTHKRMDYF